MQFPFLFHTTISPRNSAAGLVTGPMPFQLHQSSDKECDNFREVYLQ